MTGGASLGNREGASVVLVFRGTHEVLAAEKRLRGGRVTVRLIPVPRRLTSDCGLALRIPSEEGREALALLAAGGLRPASAHRAVSPDEYEPWPASEGGETGSP